ncbi:unnamed protein product (macronuclear) [Paramecium tetraurelia]|uniref:Uncharacterized protein n=1 Tax=Paramecium tetraurelia TaxID=5888 RepID=A0BFG1_PARTE|nr:uncharacterized protein GSPATT00028313001 [Paramecium tetraurelia]CAK57278.1 unnamed protein product [Paramecium tetraurelia]|eukprot:XP_001424676.1 hypothetical protein (macronuclear) [Paramecium tetraurelia strain d4-2]
MKCDFCEETTPIIDIMRHSLFLKYSQSQNYHYTKGISEILHNFRTSNNILYKDVLLYDTPEELLCKVFHISILYEKLQMLGEYYKFHNDIPRLFMMPAIIPLNYYHDKKRRLEYYRIAKLISNENKNNPDKPPKGIVGDSPLPYSSQQLTAQEASSSDEPISKCDKILEGISFIETKPQFVNFKQQLQQYQILQQTIPNFKYENYKPQIKQQAIQFQKPNNPDKQQRKSSITNILNMLKKKVPQTAVKKNNPSIKSDQLHITPRNIDIKSPTNSTLLPNQQRIATLLKSPKCVTPRAPQQSPYLPKKVQQLEIKVMSDLKTLLAKKHSRNSKQYSTVHFDSLSLAQDPRSLTQRFESANNTNGQFTKKKLNIKELNQFRRVKIQEPLSNRDPPRKLNFKSNSNDKPLSINITSEHKINLYQPAQSARQDMNSQQATISQKLLNGQSISQQIHHQKSATAKSLGKSMKLTNTLDSQICKVALNLAVKNIRTRKP